MANSLTCEVGVISRSFGYCGYKKQYDDKQWRQMPTVLPDACAAWTQDSASPAFMCLSNTVYAVLMPITLF
jgi:hypothetical protein